MSKRPAIRRSLAALFLAAAVLVCVVVVPSLSRAQDASVDPKPREPETPVAEEANVEPAEPASSPRDSIYAREITIDQSGVTIIDRNGRRITLAVDELAPRVRPPAPPPLGGHPKDVVHVFTDVVVIEPDEIIHGDVVCVFGGDIKVRGRVTGSVFTLTGAIDVEGTVDEGAVSPFGSVRVGPNGVVGADVVASHIDKEPGGRINGMRNELFFKFFGDSWQPRGARWAQTTLTVIVVLKILFWVFLVLLAHALAARNVVNVKRKIETAFFKSFLIGIVVQVLLPLVVLLLVTTIVGIPVALFLVPLMLVAAAILSMAAIGLYLGEKIDQNTNFHLPTQLGRTLVGLLATQVVPLLAVVFTWTAGTGSVLGGSMRLVALGFIGLSIVIGYVIMTLGVGAVTMTRFGTRPKKTAEAPAAAASAKEAQPQTRTHPTPLPKPSKDEPGTAHAAG
jgi:hypothetical protein